MNISSNPDTTIVIPNHNGACWLPECLTSLRAQTLAPGEVIMVDNGSTDGSVDIAKKIIPTLNIIALSDNRGFAAAVNIGIRAARSEYIGLLNTDTSARPDWLLHLHDAIKSAPPSVGGVASRMVDMRNPGIIENAGDLLSWHGMAAKRGHGHPAGDFNSATGVFSPCAGAALYRRSFLHEAGLFDEHFFAYLEDIDIGFRGHWLGYSFQYVPEAVILHHGHGAAMPSRRYVELITRNRLLVLFKNLPVKSLVRHAHHIAYGQLFYLMAYRHPLHVLRGWISFLSLARHVRMSRTWLRQHRKVDASEVEQWMTSAHLERKPWSRRQQPPTPG
ncbi:MAG: glycosyltransferase family 2 protein [bacterium]